MTSDDLYDNDKIKDIYIKRIIDASLDFPFTKTEFTKDNFMNRLQIILTKISENSPRDYYTIFNINNIITSKNIDVIVIILYIQSFIACKYIQKSNYTRATFFKEYVNNRNFIDDASTAIYDIINTASLSSLVQTHPDDEAAYMLFLMASMLENVNTTSYTTDNIVDKITGEFIGMKLYFSNTETNIIINKLLKSFYIKYKLDEKKKIVKEHINGYVINPLYLKYLFENAKSHKHFHQQNNDIPQFNQDETKILYNNIISRNYTNNEIRIDDLLDELDNKEGTMHTDNQLYKILQKKIPKYDYISKNELIFDKDNTYQYYDTLEPRIKFFDYVEKNIVKHILDILYEFNLIIKTDIKQLTYVEYNTRQKELQKTLPDIIKKFADTSLYDDFMDLAATNGTQIEMNLYVSKVSQEIREGIEDKKNTDYDGVTIVNYKQESNILIVLNRAPYTYDDNTHTSTMIRYNDTIHKTYSNTSVYKIVQRNDDTYTDYLKNNVLNNFKDATNNIIKPYNFITQGGSGSGKSYTISKILKLIIGDNNENIQNKIKVAQELISCFINARTPNNDDSSRCLTSIKHKGKSINFIVEGLECRRILTDYIWSGDKFIIHDGKSEWHNSGKGNQPFHAFLSNSNTNHKDMLKKYQNAFKYVLDDNNANTNKVGQIQKCIDKLHELSLIGSLYNDIYICIVKTPQTGGEIVTNVFNKKYLKISIDVLKDNFREFIVQDEGIDITIFNVKKPDEDDKWFENFVFGIDWNERKNDFIKFFNVLNTYDYTVKENENTLGLRYDATFLEKFNITFFKHKPNAKFEIDNIITKIHGLPGLTVVVEELKISNLKDNIEKKLNSFFETYNPMVKSTVDVSKKKLVKSTVDNILSEIKRCTNISDILNVIKPSPLISLTYHSDVKKILPEIVKPIDNNVNSVTTVYKHALLEYIRNVNSALCNTLQKKHNTTSNGLFDDKKLKTDINKIYGDIFDDLKNSGKQLSTEEIIKTLVINYKEALKKQTANKFDKNNIIEKILKTITPPQPSNILQRVILVMDLYNNEVSNLCNLLTIDTSYTSGIPPFDMIDIYGFEKKMTDSDDPNNTVIDTTSFVINHVNDRAMAAFLKALLTGLTTSYREATSKKNEHDIKNYTACINVCNYAITFIETIVNNAFGYTVNHYNSDVSKSDCIKKEFTNYMQQFNTDNKDTQLNTTITEAENTNIPQDSICSIHSTYEMVSYIIDVYSPKGMYNIKDTIKNNQTITIEAIEAYLTDLKNPPGNQKPDTATPVKICSISYNADTNFSLKTITKIIKMFEERKNLSDYTFVKCIKATTRVVDNSVRFKYVKNSETPAIKSNPVRYNDPIIQDQLKNLGISLILTIEPKKTFTLFKKSPITLIEQFTKIVSRNTEETDISNLVTFIEKNYYPTSSSSVFTTNVDFFNELRENGIFIDNGDYIKHNKTRVDYYKQKYYEVKDGFTIKKFLENLFRLYDIIPKQTQE